MYMDIQFSPLKDKNLIQRNILSIKKFKIKLTRYLNNKPSTENKIKRKGRTIM